MQGIQAHIAFGYVYAFDSAGNFVQLMCDSISSGKRSALRQFGSREKVEFILVGNKAGRYDMEQYCGREQ